MPVVFEKKEGTFSIGIWQVTETMERLLSLARLTQADQQTWEKFTSLKRKREWLTVRVLLKELCEQHPVPEIRYDEKGKPHIGNGSVVSISHTKEYVAMMLSSSAMAGIDLEMIRPEIELLSKKFLNPEEKNCLPEFNTIEHIHVIWGAKEVLYKMYGKGGLDFRDHLSTGSFQLSMEGIIRAGIHKNDFVRELQLTYLKFRDMFLVYGDCN